MYVELINETIRSMIECTRMVLLKRERDSILEYKLNMRRKVFVEVNG